MEPLRIVENNDLGNFPKR